MEQVEITGENIKLGQFLKYANLAESGALAKELIQDGLVLVNDEVEVRRGRHLYPGDRVSLEGVTVQVVAEDSE